MSKRIISGLIALVMAMSCTAAFAENVRHERVYAVVGADGTVRSGELAAPAGHSPSFCAAGFNDAWKGEKS